MLSFTNLPISKRARVPRNGAILSKRKANEQCGRATNTYHEGKGLTWDGGTWKTKGRGGPVPQHARRTYVGRRKTTGREGGVGTWKTTCRADGPSSGTIAPPATHNTPWLYSSALFSHWLPFFWEKFLNIILGFLDCWLTVLLCY